MLNTFCVLLLWGQSPERPKKEIPLITDVIASIDKAQGWTLQNNGEWIDEQNKIPFKNYAQNKRKGGKYSLGHENFDNINIRSITINNTVYSILIIYSRGGSYEFPVLEENWTKFNVLKYYVFKEDKWILMFPNSTVFNKPYAVNTDIICTGKIIDYNKESYLFEIENHIRQTIYQQERGNTNLIFAAYPIKLRDKKYFRFKFYEAINKPEIYVKYLLEYNWEKLFRNFYYEINFEDFEKFVGKIGVIEPSKINNPDYYLHFLNRGFEKFKKEEYRTALQNFIKASMVNPPDSALISIALWKGKCKFNLRTFNEALQDFDDAISRTPNTFSENNSWILAHYERGKAYNAIHDYLNACEDWNFSLQNGVNDAYDMIKKNCDKTSSGMLKAINIEKSEKFFEKGMKKFDQEDYLKALNFFESSWKYNYLSKDFKIPYYTGVCRFQLGDYVRSIDEFEQAIKLEPDTFNPVYAAWTDSYLMLGHAWQKLDYNEYACEKWHKAMTLSNSEAQDLLKNFCASYTLEKAAKENQLETNIETVKKYAAAGDYETTAAIVITGEDLGSDSTLTILSYRGKARFKTGNYKGAIADFTQIINKGAKKHTPYYKVLINSYFNRGTSKYFLGDLNGACLDWRKAVELGLTDPTALQYIDSYCKN